MPTEITVRGSFSAFQPAERGTVHANISYEGPAMEPVYDRVARDLESMKSSIVPLENDGAITWWSAEQLRTWSTRPWNSDGKILPPVHHAAVAVQVKFSDFAALSRWVGRHVAATDGFHVSRVEWALTAKRREQLLHNARSEAVRDAVTRGQQYADALGLGEIRPIAVADAGMLASGSQPQSGGGYLRAAPAASMGRVDVELAPEDIEVSAAVDARFEAGYA